MSNCGGNRTPYRYDEMTYFDKKDAEFNLSASKKASNWKKN